MRFPRLLAKSSRSPDSPRDAETIPGHSAAVVAVARVLAEEWGEQYLTSVGLDPAVFGARLRMALPRAALTHDWGKANDDFERMVRGDRTVAVQAGRHEQLSVWLVLRFEALSTWLFRGCDEAVRHAALIAVLGHHLRVEDGRDVRLRENTGRLRVTVLTGHPDFRAAMGVGMRSLELGDPPELRDVVIDLVERESFDSTLRVWLQQATAWWRSASAEERRFVAVLKALLVAADIAGSAVPRMPADPVSWTREALSEVCSEAEFNRVVERRLAGQSPRPFQRAVQASRSRITFVRAGCGSGKTAGAYLWAADKGRSRKLFFCYPTTGTASQGFADYVPPDQFEAALVHSRAMADMEDLLSNGPGDGDERLDWLARFAALAAWGAPMTVCTVDTVLGLIQNNRTGVFTFPAIANGAFVFDEIHLYDDQLFGALLRFLEVFRAVPVLLMTASLPGSRFAALKETVEEFGERLGVVEGPSDLEGIKRYRIQRGEVDGAWSRVTATVGSGARVLWVANTVDRAVELGREAEQRGLPVLPYHARYRYEDRLARHGDVIRAFSANGRAGVLAITTQVCEVSLDLSAQLLVSDLAPIPALIQRLGRLNRRVLPGQGVEAALAIVLEPARPNPYTGAELDDARRWLGVLGGGAVSQADLAAAFDRVLGDVPVQRSATGSTWLDGGVLAARGALREAGMTIPVMREEDTTRLKDLVASEQQRKVIRLTIPMALGPVAREIGGWRRIGGALVAPAGRMHYDPRFGGRWR